MYRKSQIKFYVKDAEGRKLFLNDDSNKILNEINDVRRIVSEVNCKTPSKNDFNRAYSHERDKIV
jgi:GMP synthase PP-ATPase subunit